MKMCFATKPEELAECRAFEDWPSMCNKDPCTKITPEVLQKGPATKRHWEYMRLWQRLLSKHARHKPAAHSGR